VEKVTEILRVTVINEIPTARYDDLQSPLLKEAHRAKNSFVVLVFPKLIWDIYEFLRKAVSIGDRSGRTLISSFGDIARGPDYSGFVRVGWCKGFEISFH
jgi:hypothetical protein